MEQVKKEWAFGSPDPTLADSLLLRRTRVDAQARNGWILRHRGTPALPRPPAIPAASAIILPPHRNAHAVRVPARRARDRPLHAPGP